MKTLKLSGGQIFRFQSLGQIGFVLGDQTIADRDGRFYSRPWRFVLETLFNMGFGDRLDCLQIATGDGHHARNARIGGNL